MLATEDRRFFNHFGIDVVGTMRALTVNAHAGGVVQGGSSITQQLAKNLFLTNERSISRKINEAYLALWLEHHLTKKQILSLYLDRAYMGGGAFGVQAAAQTISASRRATSISPRRRCSPACSRRRPSIRPTSICRRRARAPTTS